MVALLKFSVLAFTVSALPQLYKRQSDNDNDNNNDNDNAGGVTTGLVAPATSARATSVITAAPTVKVTPTASVIATVDGPVPTRLPNGLYQCGTVDDGLGRYYNSVNYTCFDGDILCPRLAGGLRTRPCGDACFDPRVYSCGDDEQLVDVPCSQNDDCEEIDFLDVDDVNTGGSAMTGTTSANGDDDDDDSNDDDGSDSNENENNNDDSNDDGDDDEENDDEEDDSNDDD